MGHLHGLAHLSVNGQVTVQIGTRHDQKDGFLRAIVFKGSDGLVTSECVQSNQEVNWALGPRLGHLNCEPPIFKKPLPAHGRHAVAVKTPWRSWSHQLNGFGNDGGHRLVSIQVLKNPSAIPVYMEPDELILLKSKRIDFKRHNATTSRRICSIDPPS
jgi:hypothetical protein